MDFALGLYALKPWYTRRLRRLRTRLAVSGVAPAAVTWAGVALGGGAGLALATLPRVAAAPAVAVLLLARLAAANLDGGLARESARCTRWGVVQNELGDRVADLLALAGCLGPAVQAPVGLVAVACLAATLPSWAALAVSAAGGTRRNGGPVGKTERALLLVAIAAGAPAIPVLAVLALGSLGTALLRLRAGRLELAGSAA